MFNTAGKIMKKLLTRPILLSVPNFTVETMIRLVLITCIAAEAICDALKGDSST